MKPVIFVLAYNRQHFDFFRSICDGDIVHQLTHLTDSRQMRGVREFSVIRIEGWTGNPANRELNDETIHRIMLMPCPECLTVGRTHTKNCSRRIKPQRG